MTGEINLKVVENDNLVEVARIHASAFPRSLITQLGAECVLKYYEWQIESPDNVYAIGAFIDGSMVGFCFGGVFSMALGGFLVRNKWLVAGKLVTHPWVVFHPDVTKKVIRGLGILLRFSINKDSMTKTLSCDDAHFGILSVASEPLARGKGVGRALMEQSERYAREQGFKKMFLTVNPHNVGAINFYEQLGWIKDNDVQKWQGEMKKDLRVMSGHTQISDDAEI